MEPAKRWWKKSGIDAPFIHYSLPFGVDTLMIMDADVVKEVLFSNYGERPRFMKKLKSPIALDQSISNISFKYHVRIQ